MPIRSRPSAPSSRPSASLATSASGRNGASPAIIESLFWIPRRSVRPRQAWAAPREKERTMARPIPPPPPVTTAFFPSSAFAFPFHKKPDSLHRDKNTKHDSREKNPLAIQAQPARSKPLSREFWLSRSRDRRHMAYIVRGSGRVPVGPAAREFVDTAGGSVRLRSMMNAVPFSRGSSTKDPVDGVHVTL